MACNVPLYNCILHEINDDDEVDKAQLVKDIQELDSEGQNLVYVLMRVHQLKNHENNMISIPYKGKKLKGGYKFDIDELPVTLQRILVHFIMKHKHVKCKV